MLERFITVLSEPNSAYLRWKTLVYKHGVMGRQVHDARIVAVMSACRIKRILTLNEADFARYAPEVLALSPLTILSVM
jgi:predicted nucleic acid-binding protein